MPVVVVGLHERDAPLELLECLAFSDEELPKALAGIGDSPHLSETVILSTCMRTEVYAVAERFHDGVDDIGRFLADHLTDGCRPGALAEALAVEYDEAAVRHLFEVASGIDSPVLGEGEILRQVRAAHEQARRERASGPVLDGLFRHAVEVGKRARAETGIARGVTSLAHVAVALATETSAGRSPAGGSSSSVPARWARGSSPRSWRRRSPPNSSSLSRSREKADAFGGRRSAGAAPPWRTRRGARRRRRAVHGDGGVREILLGPEDLRRARAGTDPPAAAHRRRRRAPRRRPRRRVVPRRHAARRRRPPQLRGTLDGGEAGGDRPRAGDHRRRARPVLARRPGACRRTGRRGVARPRRADPFRRARCASTRCSPGSTKTNARPSSR